MLSRSIWTDVFSSVRKAAIRSRNFSMSAIRLLTALVNASFCGSFDDLVSSNPPAYGTRTDPRIDFRLLGYEGATGMARRSSHRKAKIPLVALHGANAFADVVRDLLPTAEKVCRLDFASGICHGGTSYGTTC